MLKMQCLSVTPIKQQNHMLRLQIALALLLTITACTGLANSDAYQSTREEIMPSSALVPELITDDNPFPHVTLSTEANIFATEISVSGKLMAVGTDSGVSLFTIDGLQQLWNHPTSSSIWAIAISPNEDLIAVSTLDGLAYLLSFNNGELVETITPNLSRVIDLSFSPSGKLLAYVEGTTSESRLTIWDLERSEPLQSVDDSGNLLWFNDSKRIVTTFGLDIRVWDVETGSLQETLGPTVPTARGCWEMIYCGANIVLDTNEEFHIADYQYRDIRILDPYTLEVQRTITMTVPITTIAWAPNASILAVGDEHGTVTLWAMPEGNVSRAFSNSPDGIISSLIWSPNGSSLISIADKTITIWHLEEESQWAN